MSRKDVGRKRMQMQMLYLLLIVLMNILSPSGTIAAGKNTGTSAHFFENFSAKVDRPKDESYTSNSGGVLARLSANDSIVSDTGRVVRILAIGNSFPKMQSKTIL